MTRKLLAASAVLFSLLAIHGGAEKSCANAGPPPIWIVKTPYPFQAGSERTFDELYHGPWKVTVPLTLYASPRSRRVVGKLTAGTTVQALLGESIVVHPLRFVAAQDYQVETGFSGARLNLATMHKGDVFWVLDLGGEGTFSVWWHCRVVGWDSSEATQEHEHQLDLLGTNEERWVHIRARKAGVSGWFQDVPINEGHILMPAVPTNKSIG